MRIQNNDWLSSTQYGTQSVSSVTSQTAATDVTTLATNVDEDTAKISQAATGTSSSLQAQQTEVSAQPSISPAYSVEISQEGALLNSLNSSTASSNSDTAIATASLGDAAKTSSTAAPSGDASSATTSSVPASSDSSDDDSTASDNLSQYSTSQLKEMLSNGEITQSEYSAEITKREQEKAQEKQETETANSTSTAIDTAK
ncbi:hypothetical protein SPSIL_007700 [Sporomusa silvacetica DSM 10669]|uniref:SHOCT domain-containing protein n=1 Tax=Sporomusa silvacetica DSM 10669 TaxID=1123289 RepID=A0ABZ3IG59_9FIRM|nr:hypothetical protein [Sporomusa silvacetica]OZC16521.1 hypothetical protein SPSIL_38050 [Sporomusa silvacetica DSM 10669]